MIAFEAPGVVLHQGHCIEIMREMPDNSVDAVVTDPPYGLGNTDPAHVIEALAHWLGGDREWVPAGSGFMGNPWDAFVPPPAAWDEALRVLKPGGHLLAFAGSRTLDLMGLSVRLAGFEIRDSIAWLYGSGFPKSMDVSKAIDATLVHGGSHSTQLRATNESRPGAGRMGSALPNNGIMSDEKSEVRVTRDEAQTPVGKAWKGWGTALKPAFEPIVVARKPLDGTVARNVLTHGTGALNIDGTRTAAEPGDVASVTGTKRSGGIMGDSTPRDAPSEPHALGRWPANVLLDQSQAAALDEQTGTLTSGANPAVRGGDTDKRSVYGGFTGGRNEQPRRGTDSGGGSRFFPTFRYEAKAPTHERPNVDGVVHETVKPLDLMRWLVRLVTPKGGTILEPFAGSGTTLEAALLEGFEVIGIEREPKYLPLITSRITKPLQVTMFGDWDEVAS